MRKGLIALVVLAVSLCSCRRDIDNPSSDGKGAGQWFVICNGNEEGSKSRFSDNGLEVKDFNIWVYDRNGNLANGMLSGYTTYFKGVTEFDGAAVFPDAYGDYDVFVLANVGEISALQVPYSRSQAENFKKTFNYDSFASKGFPMAGHINVCPAFSDGRLLVKPLVARYDIRIVNESDADYEFSLKSVRSCNNVKSLYPFSESNGASSAADVTASADFFVDGTDDFNGRRGTLYLLENIQGEIFPDASRRIPSTIPPGKASCASYLQFVGTYRQKDDTGYGNVICRYYFGEGREAFVKRNCRTSMTLKLTKGILDNDDWTVEPVDWFNNGRVVFNPQSVTLAAGGCGIVDVSTYGSSGAPNPYIRYSLKYDASEFSQAGLRMDYRPSGSSVWRSYASQQLTGPCSLRLVTSFSGLGRKTASVCAVGSDCSVLSPSDLEIAVDGYATPVSITLETTDFTNMSSDGKLEFTVRYSDGTEKRISGYCSGLSLKKISGMATLVNRTDGWNYHLSDYWYDSCSFTATYSENIGGGISTVSADCHFSVWALDAGSADTRYNCFQDRNMSMSTSDHRNYYVSAKKIGTSGTVFDMYSATLCLTDGKARKIVDVNPEFHSWTVSLKGQTDGNIFSVVDYGKAISIRKPGNIIGYNASFSVQMRSGYKDMEGHSTDLQTFSVTITE